MNMLKTHALDFIDSISKSQHNSSFFVFDSIVEFMRNLLKMESQEEYFTFLHYAQEGMFRFGGSFTKALSAALLKADVFNQAKIVITFFDDLEEHAKLYKRFEEQNK